MAKILVIEDNNDINQLLTDLLKGEYDVLSAFSGTEGLLLFQQQAVDLILLDIMLPGKSGGEILKEIRLTSQVPIIILTALGDKKSVSTFLLNGADDYMTKPFDLDEVLARVAVQLRKQTFRVEAAPRYQHKKIKLDEHNFEIIADGKRVRLSKKEWAIYFYLLQHPKQIFTKEQLYEAIWHESYFAGDNTLNTHLSNLRKKITSLDDTEDYIETIWGLGVRLAGEES